jgi:hypothetical protein
MSVQPISHPAPRPRPALVELQAAKEKSELATRAARRACAELRLGLATAQRVLNEVTELDEQLAELVSAAV